MKLKKYLNNIIYPLISLGILFLVWFIVAKVVDIELIIPSIKNTFIDLGKILLTKVFYQSVLGTLYRTVISFLIALICALVLALLSMFLPFIYKLLAPIVTIIRAIPTMSIILLTIIWLEPENSPLLVAFFIIFPIMYGSIYTAITSVDTDLIEMSKAYKVSKKDKILSLYLPNIAPSFFDITKSSISLNVKIVISAEVLAQTKLSMGVMMQIAKSQLNTANLLAWTITAIVLSYLLETLIFIIKKLTIRW
jgi:NitT/TauT family transport system permease protein